MRVLGFSRTNIYVLNITGVKRKEKTLHHFLGASIYSADGELGANNK